jgi:glycosyltransferase involved in cell wall biosynthesis
MRVCMLTSVHPVWDTRIYHREARSLAQAGYQVTLIATGVNSQKTSIKNVEVVGLERSKWRLGRTLNWPPSMKEALKTKADIYHFHDPDLLFVGFLLQKYTGRPVIYDCHEPYEAKILDRQWLPKLSRPVVSIIYRVLERQIVNHLSAVIVPNDRQLLRYPDATLVRNLPRRELVLPEPRQQQPNSRQIIYIGLINEVRGVWNMLKAVNKVSTPDSELVLIGRIDTRKLEQKINAYINTHSLEQRVNLMGFIPHESLLKYLASATVGLIPFGDVPSLRIAIPTKLFEYMALGLPVVASDLPPIRPFIEQAECGILVPPSDISDLVAALEYIFTHPAEAWQLGENGRQAVLDHYNWEAEEQKLLSLYGELLHC